MGLGYLKVGHSEECRLPPRPQGPGYLPRTAYEPAPFPRIGTVNPERRLTTGAEIAVGGG